VSVLQLAIVIMCLLSRLLLEDYTFYNELLAGAGGVKIGGDSTFGEGP